jgi:hypothetical protein
MSSMLQIGEKVISLDLLEESFVCDLEKCKGACCIQGDAGAPLLIEELTVLREIYPVIMPYLRPESIEAIEIQGTHVIDENDGEPVTPLLNDKECVYAVFDRGIAFCGIEKAWTDGRTAFRKPVSCHLYPIRVREHENFTAVNYDRWPVCKPAISNGEKLNVPVYVFCRESVIRKFGKDFYNELEIAAESFSGEGSGPDQ